MIMRAVPCRREGGHLFVPSSWVDMRRSGSKLSIKFWGTHFQCWWKPSMLAVARHIPQGSNEMKDCWDWEWEHKTFEIRLAFWRIETIILECASCYINYAFISRFICILMIIFIAAPIHTCLVNQSLSPTEALLTRVWSIARLGPEEKVTMCH